MALTFVHWGEGRTEADHLTKPGSGAQWKLEHVSLPQLINEEYLPHLAAGDVTPEYIQSIIAGIEKIRDDFFVYVNEGIQNGTLDKAGPGAIDTIRRVTDRLIADRRAELEALLSAAAAIVTPAVPSSAPVPPPIEGPASTPTPKGKPALLGIGLLGLAVLMIWYYG